VGRLFKGFALIMAVMPPEKFMVVVFFRFTVDRIALMMRVTSFVVVRVCDGAKPHRDNDGDDHGVKNWSFHDVSPKMKPTTAGRLLPMYCS
jgi:hypothetical protein